MFLGRRLLTEVKLLIRHYLRPITNWLFAKWLSKVQRICGKNPRCIKDPCVSYRSVNCAQTVLKPENKWSSLALITVETRIVPTDILNSTKYISHSSSHDPRCSKNKWHLLRFSAMSCQERKIEPLLKSPVCLRLCSAHQHSRTSTKAQRT